MRITVVGIGYVGLSIGVLLSQRNKVTAFDICQDKVDQVNSRVSPIIDSDIQNYLKNKELNLKGTSDRKKAYEKSDYIVICTPTDYDSRTNQFNTASIEGVIEDSIKFSSEATIIIKSTVPVGYTDKLKIKYKKKEIIFSPEFLRESRALYDNLHPSRIIIGGKSRKANLFADILKEGAIKKDIKTLYMRSKEAEAIKLFSNTFLAMRVAFFNELDSFALAHDLDTESIINGVCLDPRIDKIYNNPSFGYGGYCLPKDSKQLLANYEDVPHTLIKAIVDSNSTRKDFIANSIIKKNPKVVGIHRLIMKSGSDNIRASSIQGIMKRLKKNKIEMIIFEPLLSQKEYYGSPLINSLDKFKRKADLIISNRISPEITDVINKVYTRDITGDN